MLYAEILETLIILKWFGAIKPKCLIRISQYQLRPLTEGEEP
jgi:hypothetical protein